MSDLAVPAVPTTAASARPRLRAGGLLAGLTTALLLVWVLVPLGMGLLWSFVDPSHSWSYPDTFPSALSFHNWSSVFRVTNVLGAIQVSFSVAPLATLLAFLLSLPTAYLLGRYTFPGKETVKILILLPIMLPGMVIALFLSPLFSMLGLAQTYAGLVIGHAFLGIPYMLRILTVSFEAVPQDVIDAAENLGASRWTLFAEVFIPLIMPGLFAAAIFTFITSLEEFNLSFVIGLPNYQTIPTILYGFLGRHFIRTDASVVSAILMLPNIVLLFAAERFLKTEYLASAFGKM
ncbi:MAG: ABC transporter permease subunit [Alphaproteobacteria bacterium]|nr:ABC transporter permease subunit [Alphaproteobacteria bacterium]